jgi:hypothetical protein
MSQNVESPELREILRIVHAADCSAGIHWCKAKKMPLSRSFESRTVARRRDFLRNGYDVG